MHQSLKKAAEKQKKTNRPVSLLPVSGMILEKAIKDQVEDFFESNNLLGKYQFGFKKKEKHSVRIASII